VWLDDDAVTGGEDDQFPQQARHGVEVQSASGRADQRGT
jgi:hypothetical protein